LGKTQAQIEQDVERSRQDSVGRPQQLPPPTESPR